MHCQMEIHFYNLIDKNIANMYKTKPRISMLLVTQKGQKSSNTDRLSVIYNKVCPSAKKNPSKSQSQVL